MAPLTESAATTTMPGPMITGIQIRAARALLGWSASRLAINAGVSYPTVQRAESVDGIPNMRTGSLAALQNTLQIAGIEFLDGSYTGTGGPGVRLRS